MGYAGRVLPVQQWMRAFSGQNTGCKLNGWCVARRYRLCSKLWTSCSAILRENRSNFPANWTCEGPLFRYWYGRNSVASLMGKRAVMEKLLAQLAVPVLLAR